MNEKGIPKRYIVSQDFFNKWTEVIANNQNGIVESNLRNLAQLLIQKQAEIIQQFIDYEAIVFSALTDKKKKELFETVNWKVWYFIMILYMDEKKGLQASSIMESCYLEDHWNEREARGNNDQQTL